MQDTPETEIGDKGQMAKAEKLWHKEIEGMPLYHGTSESMADKIGSNGFVHETKPYSVADLQYLNGILSRLGITRNNRYAEDAENKFYVTSDLRSAVGYAISGPEILSVYTMPYATEMIERYANDELKGRVTADEVEEIKAILERAKQVLNAHRPAMVVTDINAPSIRRSVEARYGYADKFYVKDAFLKGVLKDLSPQYGIDSLLHSMGNFASTEPLPVVEVKKVLKGDDFFGLTYTAEGVGEVFRECFYDIEKAPPALVEEIGERYYPSEKNDNYLRRIANFYGLSRDESETVIERAKIRYNKRRAKAAESLK